MLTPLDLQGGADGGSGRERRRPPSFGSASARSQQLGELDAGSDSGEEQQRSSRRRQGRRRRQPDDDGGSGEGRSGRGGKGRGRRKRASPKEDGSPTAAAAMGPTPTWHEGVEELHPTHHRFDSQKLVFFMGLVHFLMPMCVVAVFAPEGQGAALLIPMAGAFYGLLVGAAGYSGQRRLLLAVVVGGALNMGRIALGLYLLWSLSLDCTGVNGTCPGYFAVGWLGLGGEAVTALTVVMLAAWTMHDHRRTAVAQQLAMDEAEDRRRRKQGVAIMRRSLRRSFKAWGAELQKIFFDFDEDGNGLMDREELAKGLKTLGADVDDVQCGWLFDMIDVDNKGEIDYMTFARWFGTAKEIEAAERREAAQKRSKLALAHWERIAEGLTASVRRAEALAGLKSSHKWSLAEVRECFDHFDEDGEGELDVHELDEAFQYLNLTPSKEEIRALLQVYDSDNSGALDKDEFCHMMLHFIQTREDSGSESEASSSEEEDTLLAPSDGLVRVLVHSCSHLLSADNNGLSDPYVILKLGAAQQKRTAVVAKTLDPVFSKSFQFRLRKFHVPEDHMLYLQVMDFDRAAKDDPIAFLTVDLEKTFEGLWSDEVERTFAMTGTQGSQHVSKKLLKRLTLIKDQPEHKLLPTGTAVPIYGEMHLSFSFQEMDYRSDESFSDDEDEDAASPTSGVDFSQLQVDHSDDYDVHKSLDQREQEEFDRSLAGLRSA
eukprot:COSAG01_NODE_4323_length_5133_cov_3.742948_2_plen_715_part_00